jgi:hypothetical protein
LQNYSGVIPTNAVLMYCILESVSKLYCTKSSFEKSGEVNFQNNANKKIRIMSK